MPRHGGNRPGRGTTRSELVARVQCTCAYCGGVVLRWPIEAQRVARVFCNNTCSGAWKKRRGGKRYVMTTGGRQEHRLVWEAAHGPIPPGHHVHHVNGNKRDNRLSNLELLTASEHMRRHKQGEGSPTAKLTAANVRAIRARFAAGGVTQTALAAEYGVKGVAVSNVVTRRTWKHLP
jgi:hypothetical protein